MTDPTTRPSELSSREADKLARAFGAHIYQSGSTDLHKIILAVAGVCVVSLMGIGAVGLAKVFAIAEEVAKLNAKVEILYQERRK